MHKKAYWAWDYKATVFTSLRQSCAISAKMCPRRQCGKNRDIERKKTDGKRKVSGGRSLIVKT